MAPSIERVNVNTAAFIMAEGAGVYSLHFPLEILLASGDRKK